MKRILALFCLALAATSIAFAESATKEMKAVGGSDEQLFTKLEQDWAQALVKRDLAAIDRLVAADWMLTDPEGVLTTKAQSDADLKSGAFTIESFVLDDLMVHVNGDTAVVFGLETEKSTYKGADTSGQYRFTDVFVKRDGAWKAIATHVTKVVKH